MGARCGADMSIASMFRPIRPDERALLDGRVTDATPSKGDAIAPTLLTAIPIWFALLFVDTLFLPRIEAVEVAFVFGSLIVVLFLTFRFYMKRAWKQVREQSTHTAALRAEYRAIEEVEDWSIRVVGAIELEIDEDTGSQYYLELEDGRVLVLDETWFENEDDEENPWSPNRELIVTRLAPPHETTIIAVQRLGEPFTPSHTRELTAEEWEADPIRKEGEILPGPLSRYRQPRV